MEFIEQYAQLGIAAVSLVLMYRLASNHVEHNTQAIIELTKVITELKSWLQARN